MSIADKLTIIAENEQKVYNAGVEFGKSQGGGGATEEELEAARQEGRLAEQSDFWDMFQHNGNRKTYLNAFRGWSAEYIRPKYKAVVTDINGCGYVFGDCTNLKKVEAQYFDFSQKPTGTNNNTGYLYTFDNCRTLEEIEDIGLVPQFIYNRTFGYCSKLKTIAKIGVDENTQFADAFISCTRLENLTIEGVIGRNGFNLKSCTKLSKASITSVINALSDNVLHLETITNPTITLSKTAVENAFTIKDDVLSLPYLTSTENYPGIVITDNGDGSITVNGTPDGNVVYYLKQPSDFDLPKGTYKVELDGDTTNSIIFALECDDSSFQNNGIWEYTNGENARAFLVFQNGVNYNNVTIRPKILCDEWESLKHVKNLFWTISLV